MSTKTQTRPEQSPAKPDGSLLLCPEAAELLREVFRHSRPAPSVPYRTSMAAEFVDELRTVLFDKQGLEFEVENQ